LDGFGVLDSLRDRLAGRPASPFFARLTAGRVPTRRYLIATTARTGSTFLCSRIADYEQLGFPMEFLNESYISEFDRLFPNPNLTDFERFVAQSFSSADGVFGLKTDWWRFQAAQQMEMFGSLLQPLDLIVHLRREDFVAQAVSLALAVESDIWHDRDTGGRSIGAAHALARFDAGKIKGHARNILNQEYYWRQYIAAADAPAIDLTYESVTRDVDGAIQSLADAFHLRLGARPQAPKAERQTKTNVSQAWCDRFREDCEDFVSFWTEYRGLITAA
jgi:LPS sulfotransferase NodH